MKRLMSLDFLRGISIFAMTAFHGFESVVIAGTEGLDLETSITDPGMVILIHTITVFGYWRPFFLLISSIVHMYSMNMAYKKGTARSSILKKQIFLGTLIYSLGLLRESIFSSYGFLGVSYESKSWNYGALNNIFVSETLNMIGISIIISSIFHFFLTKNDGIKKLKRNALVFAIVGAFFIILRPLVEFGVNSYFGTDFPSVQTDVSNFPEGLSRLFWVMIAGVPEPIFPYLGTSFIGCVIGILLSQEKPSKKIIHYGYLTGLVLVLIGSLLFIIFEQTFSFVFGVMPLYYYLFHLGMQMFVIFFALRLVEFNPKYPKKFEKYGLFIRRWGILSLTIYFFQVADIVSREILFRISGIPFNMGNEVSSGMGFLLVTVVMLFWELCLRLWEKVKFKYSIDWLLAKLNAKFGKLSNSNDLLSVNGILYDDLEPIRFVD